MFFEVFDALQSGYYLLLVFVAVKGGFGVFLAVALPEHVLVEGFLV